MYIYKYILKYIDSFFLCFNGSLQYLCTIVRLKINRNDSTIRVLDTVARSIQFVQRCVVGARHGTKGRGLEGPEASQK